MNHPEIPGGTRISGERLFGPVVCARGHSFFFFFKLFMVIVYLLGSACSSANAYPCITVSGATT